VSKRPWESQWAITTANGKVDFYITNFSDDYNTLYRNEGDAAFADISLSRWNRNH